MSDILDGRVVLSPLQEQSLWARIVVKPRLKPCNSPARAIVWLRSPWMRTICSATMPRSFSKTTRALGWDQDAGAFSGWLAAFNELCRDGKLHQRRAPSARTHRACFKPTPRSVRRFCLPASTAFCQLSKHCSLRGALAMLCAKLRWARRRHKSNFMSRPTLLRNSPHVRFGRRRGSRLNPHARLLVVTQDARKRRGEIERGFLRYLGADENSPGAASLLEFSLGVPLSQIALARGAQLLLRWLGDSIAENELDWLFSTDQIAASQDESRALTAFMRALRRRGLQRPRWTLAEFLRQRPHAELPAAWVARMTQARQRLAGIRAPPANSARMG